MLLLHWCVGRHLFVHDNSNLYVVSVRGQYLKCEGVGGGEGKGHGIGERNTQGHNEDKDDYASAVTGGGIPSR